MSIQEKTKKKMTINDFKNTILSDYRLINECREASLLGRRDVLSGKGSFGIFGDGKELAQIALSKVFRDGDFRAGYYRDQTLMMALGQLTTRQMFAHLYGNPELSAEPSSGSRQMMNHFGTRFLTISTHSSKECIKKGSPKVVKSQQRRVHAAHAVHAISIGSLF